LHSSEYLHHSFSFPEQEKGKWCPPDKNEKEVFQNLSKEQQLFTKRRYIRNKFPLYAVIRKGITFVEGEHARIIEVENNQSILVHQIFNIDGLRQRKRKSYIQKDIGEMLKKLEPKKQQQQQQSSNLEKWINELPPTICNNIPVFDVEENGTPPPPPQESDEDEQSLVVEEEEEGSGHDDDEEEDEEEEEDNDAEETERAQEEVDNDTYDSSFVDKSDYPRKRKKFSKVKIRKRILSLSSNDDEEDNGCIIEQSIEVAGSSKHIQIENKSNVSMHNITGEMPDDGFDELLLNIPQQNVQPFHNTTLIRLPQNAVSNLPLFGPFFPYDWKQFEPNWGRKVFRSLSSITIETLKRQAETLANAQNVQTFGAISVTSFNPKVLNDKYVNPTDMRRHVAIWEVNNDNQVQKVLIEEKNIYNIVSCLINAMHDMAEHAITESFFCKEQRITSSIKKLALEKKDIELDLIDNQSQKKTESNKLRIAQLEAEFVKYKFELLKLEKDREDARQVINFNTGRSPVIFIKGADTACDQCKCVSGSIVVNTSEF
jgi:hypothetical protein